MIDPQIRSAVITLFLQNKGLRHISREMNLSRNTVRRILRQAREDARQGATPEEAFTLVKSGHTVPDYLPELFARAKGNVSLMQQMLQREHGETPAYSTLTRWVREAELREAPVRSGEFERAPGEESQHDTSPHNIIVGGKAVVAQCASLVLAFSRKIYMQYYPHFTRLEAKHFLLEGHKFMDGSCPCCVIDNTSVILAGGSGKNAIVAPEMVAFARTLGFSFLAHEVNDPDRKGRVERPFSWIERNFLPGRTFRDWDDLNAQALDWCVTIANVKPKRSLGRISPDAAYVQEKPHLQLLPAVFPPVFEVLERVVDVSGYVSVDTNRYSVPERLLGKDVSVYKYPAQLQIFHRGQLVATHPRIVDRRDAKRTLPEHHPPLRRASGRELPPEVSALRSAHPLIEQYVKELLRQGRSSRPVQPRRALKRLLEIKRTYPLEPFLAALGQALRYGLFDLGRLEALVLKYVSGDFFSLDDDDSEY